LFTGSSESEENVKFLPSRCPIFTSGSFFMVLTNFSFLFPPFYLLTPDTRLLVSGSIMPWIALFCARSSLCLLYCESESAMLGALTDD
jgi:hypothetical protein